jgi:hypothetical protein
MSERSFKSIMQNLKMKGVIIRNEVHIDETPGQETATGTYETIIAYQAPKSDGSTLSTELLRQIKELNVIKAHSTKTKSR